MAQSMVKFTAAMEAPHVKMDDSGRVVVTVAAPKGTSHVAVYFYEAQAAGEIKRMVDAEGKLLEEGAVGRTMKCTLPSAPFEVRTFNVLCGITPDTQYTVTYSTRGPDDLSFSPESPRSLPKTFTVPQPAAMPGAYSTWTIGARTVPTGARVNYAAPFGCYEIEIVFSNEAGDHEVRDKMLLHNAESRSGTRDVSGLKLTEKYSLTVFTRSSTGNAASPSTTFCIADNAPVRPCVPLVEVLGETSVRVSYTVPKWKGGIATTSAMIHFETGGSEFAVNPKTHQLLPIESPQDFAQNFNFQAQNASLVVSGLTADTTYSISVKAWNAFGPSPPSPKTTVTTEKSEVEVTRVRSSEERDAELIKGAVDVDVENEAPNAKRAKQAPRNLEYVAIEPKEQMRKA